MRILAALLCAVGLATSASAAPNVTNITQKGSLLIFPDIRIDFEPFANPGDAYETIVRIQNDGSSDVSVKCYWMDGYKNRVDFVIPVTRNQPTWFDARTGNGSVQVNPFPVLPSNGFSNGNRHPFLGGRTTVQAGGANVGWLATAQPGFGRYDKGMLACWVVDDGVTNQVKWNHLSGTATVYHPFFGAYEYQAYAFFVPQGNDLQPVGAAGTLVLNGLSYDACPLYQIGQITPALEGALPAVGTIPTFGNRLAVTGCNLNLNQDWVPVWTKLQFDVWNEDEVKFTGAYECADSWHEVLFESEGSGPGGIGTGQATAGGGATTIGVGFIDTIDSAAQNFDRNVLLTEAARYRVQGVQSTQCNRTKPASGHGSDVAAVTTQAVGIIAVQSTDVGVLAFNLIGTPIAAAGKFNGAINWDPDGVIPEGGIGDE